MLSRYSREVLAKSAASLRRERADYGQTHVPPSGAGPGILVLDRPSGRNWEHQAAAGNTRRSARRRKKDDPLLDWVNSNKSALQFPESVDATILQNVVDKGYAPDLTDDALEEIGRDPFLIAYGMAGPDRCVVTTEVSKPGKKRQNRKVPDVRRDLGVTCHNPFTIYRNLGFHTKWQP